MLVGQCHFLDAGDAADRLQGGMVPGLGGRNPQYRATMGAPPPPLTEMSTLFSALGQW